MPTITQKQKQKNSSSLWISKPSREIIEILHYIWKLLTHQLLPNVRKSFVLAALIFGIRTCRHHVFVPTWFAASIRRCPCDGWPGIVDPMYMCNCQRLECAHHDVESKIPVEKSSAWEETKLRWVDRKWISLLWNEVRGFEYRRTSNMASSNMAMMIWAFFRCCCMVISMGEIHNGWAVSSGQYAERDLHNFRNARLCPLCWYQQQQQWLE